MGLLPLCKVVCDLLLNDRIKGERELLISSWGHRRDHSTEPYSVMGSGLSSSCSMLYGHYSSIHSHAAVQKALSSSVCQA